MYRHNFTKYNVGDLVTLNSCLGNINHFIILKENDNPASGETDWCEYDAYCQETEEFCRIHQEDILRKINV